MNRVDVALYNESRIKEIVFLRMFRPDLYKNQKDLVPLSLFFTPTAQLHGLIKNGAQIPCIVQKYYIWLHFCSKQHIENKVA